MEAADNDRAYTIWLTGLPCAGKSTLAAGITEVIRRRGRAVEFIDSGALRRTVLGETLGFTRGDRDANVRRHAFAAGLLARNGVVAVVAAVSPYRATRDEIRASLGDFVEVWVSTPRATCIDRDQRGVWSRALSGEIRSFTGVDDPYEPPLAPEVTCDLSELSRELAVGRVIGWLEAHDMLPPRGTGAGTDEDEAFRADGEG